MLVDWLEGKAIAWCLLPGEGGERRPLSSGHVISFSVCSCKEGTSSGAPFLLVHGDQVQVLETSESGDEGHDDWLVSISGSSSSFKMSDSTEFEDMNSITSSSCETCSLAAEDLERGLITELLLKLAPQQAPGIVSISRETALSSSGALILASSLEAFTVEGEEKDEEGLSEETLEATSCALLIVEETKSASRKHIALAAGRLSFVREDSTTRLASRNLSIVVL